MDTDPVFPSGSPATGANHPSPSAWHRGPGLNAAPRAVHPDLAAITSRIAALQRQEPAVRGRLRSDVLSEVTLIQLQTERLALRRCRTITDERRLERDLAALRERLDAVEPHWQRAA